MSGKIQLATADRPIYADPFNEETRSRRIGSAGGSDVYPQDHPSESLITDCPIAEWETNDGQPGIRRALFPYAYVNGAFDTGDSHNFEARMQEYYFEDEPMTDSGDSLTFVLGYEMADETGDYAAEIYVDGILQTTGYTLDPAKGEVTFSATQTGDVTFKGFVRLHLIVYGKAYTDPEYTYAKWDNLYTELDLLNGFFYLWDNSTTPSKWTVQGNVSQQNSDLGGVSCAKLIAQSGTTKISQQINLTSAISSCVAVCVCRTSSKGMLRVAMDGVNFNEVKVPTGSLVTNKWIFLAVQSPSSSSTQITVEFHPQENSGDTSTAYVEFIGVFKGALQ